MKLGVGTRIRTKTRTKDDVFGTVTWRVEEVGKTIRNPFGPGDVDDGVKCVLEEGAGPAAVLGYTVWDTESRIAQDVDAGIAEVLEG